jgi:hypothetical protein
MNSRCATCEAGTLYPQTGFERAMMNGVQSKTMATDSFHLNMFKVDTK